MLPHNSSNPVNKVLAGKKKTKAKEREEKTAGSVIFFH
jgi:hypothetical protein